LGGRGGPAGDVVVVAYQAPTAIKTAMVMHERQAIDAV